MGSNIFSRIGRLFISHTHVHLFLGSSLAAFAILLFLLQPQIKQFDGDYYVVLQHNATTVHAAEFEEASGTAVIQAAVPIVTTVAATPAPVVTPKPKVYAQQFTTPQLASSFTPPAVSNSGAYHSPLHVAPKLITTPFRAGHPGVDLATDFGTAVYPTADGYVESAGWSLWGYGQLVIVVHGDGVKTYYAHLSKINVSAGQKVTRDTALGNVGSTGHSSGPHLHFEIHKNDVPFNPFSVFTP